MTSEQQARIRTVPAEPPWPAREDGETRRVGVEIEFAGIPARHAAELVAEAFGGMIEMEDPHRHRVAGTRWGDFIVELDTKYAHPDGSLDQLSVPEWMAEGVDAARDIDARFREFVGDAVGDLVPTEIILPPIPWHDLAAVDDLVAILRRAGAAGTDGSPIYGFGLHLNPEAAATDAAYILDNMRAYFLLADWLREEIDVDTTRRLLPHADPFPPAYVERILAPDYAPGIDGLIDDYLTENPTRNRDLDLLPLFAALDPARVRRHLDDDRVKPRPTFHYRLPNSALGDPDWSVTLEWNRWVEVERLAADHERLAALSAEYLEHARTRWANRLRQLFR